MITKRDKNKTIKEVLPKNIKSEVEVKRMDIPGFLKTNNFDKRATGSSLKWEDYHENDEVNHGRGLTIDDPLPAWQRQPLIFGHVFVCRGNRPLLNGLLDQRLDVLILQRLSLVASPY